MENEMLDTKLLFRKFNKEALRSFGLPKLIERIKQNQSWKKGELNSMVLSENQRKKIVLTALHEGTEIDSFQANDSVTIQVIEGIIKFNTQKESITLEKDESLTLHEHVSYNLISKEDTILLLTIASYPFSSIVKN